MTDRRLGYIVLLLLLSAIAVTIGYGVYLCLFPAHDRIIAFSDVGSIRIEDPLVIRGIPVGTIRRIDRKEEGGCAYIHIQSPKELHIHADYQVVNSEVGLMGDRVLTLDCGSPEFPLVPERDTLIGMFYPGASEAVGRAWKLRDALDRFGEGAAALMTDSPEEQSLLHRFDKLVRAIDSTTAVLELILTEGDTRISGLLDTVEALSGSASRLAKTGTHGIPRYIVSADRFVTRLDSLTASLSSFLEAAGDVTSKAAAFDAELWPHLSNLKGQLKTVREAAAELRDKGLPLNVKVLY